MFRPLLLLGCSEHSLKMNDIAINDAIMERKNIRLSDNPTQTLSEDSYLPKKVPAVHELLVAIDKIIQKEVHPYLETFNEWAHILEANEQTMFHSHRAADRPPGVSWVYYSKVPKHSGNLVFTFEACANRVMQEVEPEVGKLVIFPDFLPHFTKKNNSGETRISISGNSAIPEHKIKDVDSVGMHNLLNYIGIFAG